MLATTELPDGTILVQGRESIDEGGGVTAIVEGEWTVEPGGELFGVAYELWAEEAPGPVDVEELRARRSS